MDMVKIPRKVVLIITFRCQLRCRICNVDSICLGREELTTSEIIGILNNLSKDGVSAVDFVGGEIFVRNDIREILKISRELFREVAIITNGIDGLRYADFILSLPLDHITISLDGANSMTHDYVRGDGSFDKVMEFLRYIKLSKKIDVKPFITINTVILGNNISELADVMKLASSLGCNNITYQVLLSDNTNFKLKKLDGQFWVNGSNLSLLAEQVQMILEAKRKGNAAINIGNTVSYLDNIVNYYTDALKPNLFTCRHGIDFITVGPEGKIYLCNFSLGDLTREDFASIWNSENTRKALASILHCEKPCMMNCMVGGIESENAFV